QSRVHVGVAAAGPRRDGQLFDEARENLPALGVRRALLVLDRMPLGMAGHVLELQKNQRIRDQKSYHTAGLKACTTTGKQEPLVVRTFRSASRPSREDYPHIGPFVPGPALIVAQHGLNGESGGFDAVRHL